jgi:glycosyltransferase involved in cell wall biosynthesis
MIDRQTAAVIIPTTGRPTLRRAVQSVLAQMHPGTVAVVVVDGPQYGQATLEALDEMLPHPRIQLIPLPQNTGANGYQGHRIYGSIPQLVNQDWIFWLDDDNWLEPDHVAECVGSCVEHGLSWCATLRNIYEPDGTFLCVDECESLAIVPTWFNPSAHHVDTSCFCLSREVAIQLSMHWHRPHLPYDVDPAKAISPDTAICNVLRADAPRYALIARPTVNYTLGSREITPKPDFFTTGNSVIRKRYGGKLPWESWPATTRAVGFHSSAERWDQCRLSIESFHEHHGTEDLAYYLLWMGEPGDMIKVEFPDYLRILTWNDFDPIYREKLCCHGPMSGYPRPLMIRHMQERHEAVMFVDADMMTYAPLWDLFAEIQYAEKDAIVTPHRLTPAPRDGKRLQMEHFALFGNYNSGFTAWSNRPEAKSFVDWYLAISLEADQQDPHHGRYSEQGWLRFVGDFLDKALVLRDPSVNVAWWRIDSPDQITQVDGRWMIDGEPLRLFHFSGIDFDDLGSINIHQERVRGSGGLLKLYEEYRNSVMRIRRSIVPAGQPGNEHADADTTT